MAVKPIQQEVVELVAILDKERRTGFCDEYGILQSFLDNFTQKQQQVAATNPQISRLSIMENALQEIATNEGATRNKMVQTAKHAIARANKIKNSNFH